MEPADAARGSDRLLGAMEKETDAVRLSRLTDALSALAARLEPAFRHTQNYAWSNRLLERLPAPPEKGEPEAKVRTRFATFLQPLDKRDLTNILKWPFCVGEAEKLVLAELERKLSAEFQREIQFGGDVGKFVAQAKALGIHHLAEPAQRPTLAAARAELAEILQAAEKQPKPPLTSPAP